MKAVIQRVANAAVEVGGETVGKCGKGFMILLGVMQGDTKADADKLVKKIVNLRIFEDENEKMNLSVKDVGGSILAISQFTLLGDVRKGKRPSFITAEDPEIANRLYQQVCENIRNQGITVETGIFQADMKIEAHNDGPVTIWYEN